MSALVCNKRYSRGSREYKLALELTEGRSALRRRGLLDVAVYDLKEAMEDEQSPLAEAAEVQDGLQAQLQALEEAHGKALEDGQARLAEMKEVRDELRLLAKEFEETRRGWQPHAE